VHLVFLQHGLWGNTTDVSNLETFLRQQLRPQDAASDGEDSKHGPAADAVQQMHEEVQILNSDVNRKALTYDGKHLAKILHPETRRGYIGSCILLTRGLVRQCPEPGR
jgi:hypothetical protein